MKDSTEDTKSDNEKTERLIRAANVVTYNYEQGTLSPVYMLDLKEALNQLET